MTSITPLSSCFTPTRYVPLSQAVGQICAVPILSHNGRERLVKAGKVFTLEAVSRIATEIGSCDVCILRDNTVSHFILLHDPQALSDGEITDYADLFREIFSNPPYNQMAFAPPRWDMPLGATEVLYDRQAEKTDYVGLADIDRHVLPQHLLSYMDRTITRAVMADRFSDPGYLACLYECGSGRLCGFSFARVATLSRIWQTEEWCWPLILRGDRSVKSDGDSFFAKMKQAFGISPDDRIVSVSGQAIHPSVRGRADWFAQLMAATCFGFTSEHAALPGLTELSKTGPSRLLNTAVAVKTVTGILENGNPLAYVPLASHSLWHYEGPKTRLRDAIRRQIKQERANVHAT
ncbi:hypothetical protein [Fretibacter rubidus]|uniref:hypothetical protein n=1 Tax=Fretibacter rubidus TaxID=570162 RepID=UPI00352B200E